METGKELTKTETEPINIMGSLQPGQNFDAMLSQAEKFVKFHARIRELALTVTSVADWVNQDGKPYLEWTGASKIAQTFGVSYGSPVFEKETGEDEKGQYVIFHCSGPVTWNGRSVPEIGSGSTRDSFFGKSHGEFLPLSEIDMTDVKKKGMTNFLNRGLKSLLGLSFTWDEIEKITKGRITRNTVDSVNHDSKNASPESQGGRSEIMKMLTEYCGGVAKAIAEALVHYSEWTNKSGDKFAGKTDVKYLSDKQVEIVLEKIRADYDPWKAKQNDGVTAKDRILQYKKRTTTAGKKDAEEFEKIVNDYFTKINSTLDDCTNAQALELHSIIAKHYNEKKEAAK